MANEIVGGSSGTAGGGGGGGAAGGGGAGDAAVYQGTSATESGDFKVAYSAATDLILSDLPFPPLFENFVAIYEYNDDNLVKSYDIEDANYDWTWTPAADATTGTLTVVPVVFGATNTFVVVLRGPKKDIQAVLADFSGQGVHRSPRDLTVAWASATTLDFTTMAMDPDVDQIMAVAEIATGGRVRMVYTRHEWAFTWAAGAAGEGVLSIASATMQATSSFIAFIEAHDFSTDAADTARTVATLVKPVQLVDAAGLVQPAGADAASAITMMQLGQLMGMTGNGIYKSDIHFTAVQSAATTIDIAGGFPSISGVGQFLGVAQISSVGAVTIFYPHQNVFAWDAVNDRLSVTGGAFVGTDVFVMVIAGADRYANDPGNHLLSAEVNHFPTQGDSAGVDLLAGGAQDFTAGWVDSGPELSLLFIGWLETFWTLNINDSTGLQVRLVEKHESGGAEEYPASVETYGVAAVAVQAGYHAVTEDVDQLIPLTYKISGKYPIGQLQIKAGVLGAGVDASVDALRVIRSTFEG